jgi:hypothetical protein
MVDGNKIAIAELCDPREFPKNDMESHLIIIGLLENIKDKHLACMKTLIHKTATKDNLGCIKIENEENDLEDDKDDIDDVLLSKDDVGRAGAIDKDINLDEEDEEDEDENEEEDKDEEEDSREED